MRPPREIEKLGMLQREGKPIEEQFLTSFDGTNQNDISVKTFNS